MAGFAPFGRDDQPLLEVKIVGGKRIEVEVDKYGKPLYNDQPVKPKLDGSSKRFSRSLSEERSPVGFSSPKNSSLPPWARDGTPPKKILKPLGSPIGSEYSTQSYGSSLPSSPKVLPPIGSKVSPRRDGNDAALMQELRFALHQFDTAKLKEAYMSFAGMDSTLTGFVGTEQIEHIFNRYRIPIKGEQLSAVMKKFTSATRLNWVNYEHMLKFLNNVIKTPMNNANMYDIPKLDLDMNPGDRARGRIQERSPWEPDITLKPNQVSPRPVHDGSSTGRQSVIHVKRAFQDRQDAQLLIEMERLFKQVPKVQEQIGSLYGTLQDYDVANAQYMNSQKLKTICLRHHLPLNGSLLDKIIEKLDPRYTGKVSWVEFMAFVERAVPLSSTGSSRMSRRTSHTDGMIMPPEQPTWVTRQPLQAVGRRRHEDAALQQEELYNDQKKILDHHLVEQSEELAQVMNKHQRHLDKQHRALPKDHINELQHPERDYGSSYLSSQQSSGLGDEQADLEARHQTLLRQQFELIEQKRRIQKEQEDLDRYMKDSRDDVYGSGGDKPHVAKDESKVERFLRLANALYLCDKDGSGYLENDLACRLVKNYNLVYQLEMSDETIYNGLNACRTSDDMVSIDNVLEQLKKNI